MGDQSQQYKAVIFNPVPGPPMGPNTRLSFRYKLTGTSDMRVQLYSLTNGYHRYLRLADLPQGVWSTGTVDMTKMRRPDGNGGPLSADERIDDIQFYIDPAADLLIDDVILYDAAAEDETRPFPKRVIFTGWFDTGKQGKEWPGEFEIVPHDKPRAWKFVRSIPGPDGKPHLVVGLRGARRLSPVTRMSFNCRLTGADSFQLEWRHGEEVIQTFDVSPMQTDSWTKAVTHLSGNDNETTIDNVRFNIPAGGTLSIDDMLLYEP
jgi:hypothetical protein